MKRSGERLLAELKRMQSSGGREELQAFSMEGTRLVERALAAKIPLRAALCSASFASSRVPREESLMRALRAAQVELTICEDPIMREFTGGRTFGSIVAVAPVPQPPELPSLLEQGAPGTFRPGVLVVFDALDPGNVGALLRTALASGARAFVSVGSTDPFHPKAVRTSMGSLFRTPLLHFKSTELFVAAAAPLCELCGAVSQGGASLRGVRDQLAGERPIALCVGSEAFGLDASIVAHLDRRLTIPMPDNVDSLSINAAAAVCLYELLGP